MAPKRKRGEEDDGQEEKAKRLTWKKGGPPKKPTSAPAPPRLWTTKANVRAANGAFNLEQRLVFYGERVAATRLLPLRRSLSAVVADRSLIDDIEEIAGRQGRAAALAVFQARQRCRKAPTGCTQRREGKSSFAARVQIFGGQKITYAPTRTSPEEAEKDCQELIKARKEGGSAMALAVVEALHEDAAAQAAEALPEAKTKKPVQVKKPVAEGKDDGPFVAAIRAMEKHTATGDLPVGVVWRSKNPALPLWTATVLVGKKKIYGPSRDSLHAAALDREFMLAGKEKSGEAGVVEVIAQFHASWISRPVTEEHQEQHAKRLQESRGRRREKALGCDLPPGVALTPRQNGYYGRVGYPDGRIARGPMRATPLEASQDAEALRAARAARGAAGLDEVRAKLRAEASEGGFRTRLQPPQRKKAPERPKERGDLPPGVYRRGVRGDKFAAFLHMNSRKALFGPLRASLEEAVKDRVALLEAKEVGDEEAYRVWDQLYAELGDSRRRARHFGEKDEVDEAGDGSSTARLKAPKEEKKAAAAPKERDLPRGVYRRGARGEQFVASVQISPKKALFGPLRALLEEAVKDREVLLEAKGVGQEEIYRVWDQLFAELGDCRRRARHFGENYELNEGKTAQADLDDQKASKQPSATSSGSAASSSSSRKRPLTDK